MRTKARPTLRSDSRGVVYVEFLLAFMPLFTLFLVLLQLLLLWCGRILVQHAADRAARAASVVLDDDPAYYGDERRLVTGGEGVPADDLLALYLRVEGVETPLPTPMSRRGTIEAAAMLPLVPLMSTKPESVRSAITPSAEADAVQRAIARTRVDVDAAPDARDVEVSVHFRFPCEVPVAARIVCGGEHERALVYRAQLANQVADYPYLGGGV